MSISRRAFLSRVAAGGAATAVGVSTRAEALQRPPKPRLPEAVGLLYDSTLCVGCKACVAGCKQANAKPVERSAEQAVWNSRVTPEQGDWIVRESGDQKPIWDTPRDTSGDTYLYPRGDINGRFGAGHPPHEKIITAQYRPEVFPTALTSLTPCTRLRRRGCSTSFIPA